MDKLTISLNWNNTDSNPYQYSDKDCNYSAQMKSVTTKLCRRSDFGIIVLLGLISLNSNASNPVVSFSDPSTEIVNQLYANSYQNESEYLSILRLELKEEVAALSNLQDNWDGEGANRVSTTSISHALDLLDSEHACIKRISGIFASRNGFVSIQWEDAYGQMIGLELGRKQMSYFVTLHDRSIYHDAETINTKNLSVFFKNLALL